MLLGTDPYLHIKVFQTDVFLGIRAHLVKMHRTLLYEKGICGKRNNGNVGETVIFNSSHVKTTFPKKE